jgi:hypothetical protein
LRSSRSSARRSCGTAHCGAAAPERTAAS